MTIRTKPLEAPSTGRLNMYLEADMLDVIKRFAQSRNISLGGAARKLLGDALALRGLWKPEDTA